MCGCGGGFCCSVPQYGWGHGQSGGHTGTERERERERERETCTRVLYLPFSVRAVEPLRQQLLEEFLAISALQGQITIFKGQRTGDWIGGRWVCQTGPSQILPQIGRNPHRQNGNRRGWWPARECRSKWPGVILHPLPSDVCDLQFGVMASRGL